MVTVYATRNTEYHLNGDVCVAVRDRGTLAWLEASRVIGQRVTCMVVSVRGHLRKHALSSRIGSCLWFDSIQAMTSSIRVIRPATSDEVAEYPPLPRPESPAASPAPAAPAASPAAAAAAPVPLLRRADEWLETLPAASRQVLEDARSQRPTWPRSARDEAVVLRPVIGVGAPRRPSAPPSGETRL